MMKKRRSALMMRRLSFRFLVREEKERERAFVFGVPPPVMETFAVRCCFPIFSPFFLGFAVFRYGMRRFEGPGFWFLV